MVKGVSKVDTVTLLAFKVDLGLRILTKVELSNSKTGEVLGESKSNECLVQAEWGEDTIAALQEAQRLIERDVAKVHIDIEEDEGKGKGLQFPTGGIGETLGSEDVPSI